MDDIKIISNYLQTQFIFTLNITIKWKQQQLQQKGKQLDNTTDNNQQQSGIDFSNSPRQFSHPLAVQGIKSALKYKFKFCPCEPIMNIVDNIAHMNIIGNIFIQKFGFFSTVAHKCGQVQKCFFIVISQFRGKIVSRIYDQKQREIMGLQFLGLGRDIIDCPCQIRHQFCTQFFQQKMQQRYSELKIVLVIHVLKY
eukprot:TRINITY_DN14089_c1_g1_i1.p2 TRINITY_DN14089_c1_g1~~TRINITY_DN14089_c1_g1_i1.p2  ORF type:complete len:196 (+),score=-2.43 TRINITY_DN14089_c1_g1_i1:116-703(+)